ncbi:MAG: phage shock protein PspA [Alphaproteobacteria bacterium]
MSIFSRLADIVNANINSLLDRAEDPEKTIRLMIQEMEDTLVDARATAARTIADRKEIERRLARLGEAETEWQRKAELALNKGREDLAKAALTEKQRIAQSVEALGEELGQLVGLLDRHSDDIAKLEKKLVEVKAKQKSIQARADSAVSRLQVRQRTYDGRVQDAMNRFERMERRVDNAEAEVEAFDLGRGRDLAEEIADLETDQAVEAELAALKERMKGNAAGET